MDELYGPIWMVVVGDSYDDQDLNKLPVDGKPALKDDEKETVISHDDLGGQEKKKITEEAIGPD